LLLKASVFGQLPSYDFTTIAGLTATTGLVDGTNSDARFNYPCEIAVDYAGSLYVADGLNHTIRQMRAIGTNWIVTTVAGIAGSPGGEDGTNGVARFNRPAGVAVDGSGTLFVADRYNHTIRKISRSGTNFSVTTIAGVTAVPGHADGTNSDAQFYLPIGITLDHVGNLYVADTANFIIRKIAPVGTDWVTTTIAGSATNYGFHDGTNQAAKFDYPYGIASSGDGKLYVTDFGNHSIRQVAPIGTNWVTKTIAGFSGALGTNDGPGTSASFNCPNGVVIDSAEHIFVVDQYNNTIRRIIASNTSWIVATVAGAPGKSGSTDGTNNAARFNKPWGITADPSGNLYVVDWLNQTIRMGGLIVPPPPYLSFGRNGNQLVLSWPASASNFNLEISALVGVGQSWSAVSNGVTAMPGIGFVWTNPSTASPRYFRLHGR